MRRDCGKRNKGKTLKRKSDGGEMGGPRQAAAWMGEGRRVKRGNHSQWESKKMKWDGVKGSK